MEGVCTYQIKKVSTRWSWRYLYMQHGGSSRSRFHKRYENETKAPLSTSAGGKKNMCSIIHVSSTLLKIFRQRPVSDHHRAAYPRARNSLMSCAYFFFPLHTRFFQRHAEFEVWSVERLHLLFDWNKKLIKLVALGSSMVSSSCRAMQHAKGQQ